MKKPNAAGITCLDISNYCWVCLLVEDWGGWGVEVETAVELAKGKDLERSGDVHNYGANSRTAY